MKTWKKLSELYLENKNNFAPVGAKFAKLKIRASGGRIICNFNNRININTNHA